MAAKRRRTRNGALQGVQFVWVLRQKMGCAPFPCKNMQSQKNSVFIGTALGCMDLPRQFVLISRVETTPRWGHTGVWIIQKINFYWGSVCGSSGELYPEYSQCKSGKVSVQNRQVCGSIHIADTDKPLCRFALESLSFIKSAKYILHYNSNCMITLIGL